MRGLVAAGHAARALSRSTAGDVVCLSLGARPVHGDRGDTLALSQGMAGCSAVFHVAADTSTETRHRARQTETNVEGPRRVLQAAHEADLKAFMCTSSVSAYSHLVRASLVPWTVFHPAHVRGPGDRQNWTWVIRLIDQEAMSGIQPGLAVVADVHGCTCTGARVGAQVLCAVLPARRRTHRAGP